VLSRWEVAFYLEEDLKEQYLLEHIFNIHYYSRDKSSEGTLRTLRLKAALWSY
jgi:hypothetical protein